MPVISPTLTRTGGTNHERFARIPRPSRAAARPAAALRPATEAAALIANARPLSWSGSARKGGSSALGPPLFFCARYADSPHARYAAAMRFSLKWLLTLMAYVALAAVAFNRALDDWIYSDLLAAITFCALTYAVVLAFFSRGSHRGAAIGFAVASLFYIACLRFLPNETPTARLVDYFYPTWIERSPSAAGNGPTLSRVKRKRPPSSGSRSFIRGTTEDQVVDRAANSVTTMLAGLIGSALGALAARQASTSALGDRRGNEG